MSNKHYLRTAHRFICGAAQKEIALPKFFCNSCEKRIGSQCTFFDRHITADYNKCFYHSFYSPDSVKFKPPENLEEIAMREDKQNALSFV